MFLALLLKSPVVLMYGIETSTPSAAGRRIICRSKQRRRRLVTPRSVAWADRITANQ